MEDWICKQLRCHVGGFRANSGSIVNCAGIAVEATVGDAPVWEVAEETWDADMLVNAKGVFLCCKYAAAQMIKQEPFANGDRGWIINISSQVGLVGLPGIGKSCNSLPTSLPLVKILVTC